MPSPSVKAIEPPRHDRSSLGDLGRSFAQPVTVASSMRRTSFGPSCYVRSGPARAVDRASGDRARQHSPLEVCTGHHRGGNKSPSETSGLQGSAGSLGAGKNVQDSRRRHSLAVGPDRLAGPGRFPLPAEHADHRHRLGRRLLSLDRAGRGHLADHLGQRRCAGGGLGRRPDNLRGEGLLRRGGDHDRPAQRHAECAPLRPWAARQGQEDGDRGGGQPAVHVGSTPRTAAAGSRSGAPATAGGRGPSRRHHCRS